MSNIFQWQLHGDGKTLAPGEVVEPDERLTWVRTAGIGAQHVIAMFGATFLVPILTGFDPSTTLFFTAMSTALFLLINKNMLPSYLGSSFGFIAPIAAVASAHKGLAVASFGIMVTGILLALIGVLIIAVMLIKQVKGAILYGILLTWILGMLCQVTGLYVPTPDAGFYSLFPSWGMTDFSKLGLTFGQCFNVDFSAVGIVNFIVVIFSFLFVDIFDTLGTLIGVATKAKMLDKDGKLPGIKPALLADSIATSAGAILGTSTTTTFVESASGVAVGGRTGLTALVTGILFLVSTLFAPIFTAIPSFATAPALIMVGFLMVGTVTEINFDLDNLTESIPAYLAIIAMPLFYSISEGISMGVISYVLLNVAAGKGKKIAPLMYVLAVLFVLKYIFL